MVRKCILAMVCFLAWASPAMAKLNVVATLPWIGSLASEIGGDRIKVTTLVKPNQDPHYVEAKPSMILEVRRADLLMFNGLELEIGYLPVLVESSRNPMIQPGTPGYFDCSQFVEVIEKPDAVSRSMGDVHPLGNPHYHLSPKNIYRVIGGVTEILVSTGRTSPPGRKNLRRKKSSGRDIILGGRNSLPIINFSSIWPMNSSSRSLPMSSRNPEFPLQRVGSKGLLSWLRG
jgi:hypothetical protein